MSASYISVIFSPDCEFDGKRVPGLSHPNRDCWTDSSVISPLGGSGGMSPETLFQAFCRMTSFQLVQSKFGG